MPLCVPPDPFPLGWLPTPRPPHPLPRPPPRPPRVLVFCADAGGAAAGAAAGGPVPAAVASLSDIFTLGSNSQERYLPRLRVFSWRLLPRLRVSSRRVLHSFPFVCCV